MKLLIKKLINQLISQIKNDIVAFLTLIIIHTLIMIGIVLLMNWISEHIMLYQLQLGTIVFRVALFSFVLGVWIGYFKLLLQFIDNQKISVIHLLNFFYLLPKILIIRFLSYLTLLPIFIFIINKFPYDREQYGTNIENYFSNLLENLTTMYVDEISWSLYSAYFTYVDIIIMMVLIIPPIWFTIRFWCLEIIILDRDLSVKDALRTSYALTPNIHYFITIGLLISILNVVMMALGFIIFMIALTASYIVLFNYYRILLSKNS